MQIIPAILDDAPAGLEEVHLVLHDRLPEARPPRVEVKGARAGAARAVVGVVHVRPDLDVGARAEPLRAYTRGQREG